MFKTTLEFGSSYTKNLKARWACLFSSILVAQTIGSCQNQTKIKPSPLSSTNVTPPAVRYQFLQTGTVSSPTFPGVDLDGDQIEDRIEVDGWGAKFEIYFSKSVEKTYRHDFNGISTHSLTYTTLKSTTQANLSVLIGVSRRDPNGTVHDIKAEDHVSPWLVRVNSHGDVERFEIKEIRGPITHISCETKEQSQQSLCFFSDYYGNSKVGFVDDLGGFTNLTHESGLPFPVTWKAKFTNGFHVMGASWMDYDLDGDMDLIAVAQHSDLMIFTREDSTDEGKPRFKTDFQNPADEYMAVYSLQNAFKIPCYLVAMEANESAIPDQLRCYDSSSRTWSTSSLGAYNRSSQNQPFLNPQMKTIAVRNPVSQVWEEYTLKTFLYSEHKPNALELSLGSGELCIDVAEGDFPYLITRPCFLPGKRFRYSLQQSGDTWKIVTNDERRCVYSSKLSEIEARKGPITPKIISETPQLLFLQDCVGMKDFPKERPGDEPTFIKKLVAEKRNDLSKPDAMGGELFQLVDVKTGYCLGPLHNAQAEAMPLSLQECYDILDGGKDVKELQWSQNEFKTGNAQEPTIAEPSERVFLPAQEPIDFEHFCVEKADQFNIEAVSGIVRNGDCYQDLDITQLGDGLFRRSPVDLSGFTYSGPDPFQRWYQSSSYHLAWVMKDEYWGYDVDFNNSQFKKINVRHAGGVKGDHPPQLRFHIGDSRVDLTIEATGGWYDWKTSSAVLNPSIIPKGHSRIKVEALSWGIGNLDYFWFSND